MTTNVYDGVVKLMTTDSRWSYQDNGVLFFIDDTGFDKIELTHNRAYMFAGNGALINAWKLWLRSVPTNMGAHPPVDGIAVCMVRTSDGTIAFEHEQGIKCDNARFSGSGSIYAYECWSANGNARKAVETAKGADRLSGGHVKFLELGSLEHNLNRDSDISYVADAFSTRGKYMILSASQQAMPVNEAAANEGKVEEIARKIVNGEIAMTAPCDSMYREWTADDKHRLQDALAEAFAE
jgi:hypothetical protein